VDKYNLQPHRFCLACCLVLSPGVLALEALAKQPAHAGDDHDAMAIALQDVLGNHLLVKKSQTFVDELKYVKMDQDTPNMCNSLRH
jgi:hypothetical protein